VDPLGVLLGGKYLLGELIGAGGMGTVHVAAQPALGRTVAIKILRPELVDDPRMHRHFEREAIAGARMAHPNLVTIYELAFTDDRRPFLVMEQVHGRLLGSLTRECTLSVHRAHELTAQLLAVLGEVHRAGIVHADIKADNVMVETTRDRALRIRLLDFGLARIAPGPGDDPADPRFADDQVIDSEGLRYVSGTPEYMAPEVIRGGLATVASDLYGAGVILYELLTGVTPFAGGAPVEVVSRHLTEAPMRPSVARPDRYIPPAIEAVIARALAKEPRERFASADAFAAALGRAVPAEPPALWCPDCGAAMPPDGGPCASCAPAGAATARPASSSTQAITAAWPAALPAPPPPSRRTQHGFYSILYPARRRGRRTNAPRTGCAADELRARAARTSSR
jgi:serine/threonine-protein kinase